MIKKIDKIRDLLIVPSVDEQPKMAINQMKILNLLAELRANAEQLTIPVVSQQRELLEYFCKLANITHDTVDKDIKDTICKINEINK